MILRRQNLVILLAAAACCLATAPAEAARLTVEYSGEINHLIDPNQVLDPSIQLGVPYYGSFTYESEGAIDLTPEEPQVGTYSFPFLLDLHMGSTTIETTPVLMEVSDNGGSSGVDEIIVGQVSFEAAGLSIVGLLLTFTSDTDQLFSGTEAPNEWTFDSFPIPRMVLIANDFSVDLGGIISTFAVTPEPGSMLFVVSGVVMLLLGWRGQRFR